MPGLSGEPLPQTRRTCLDELRTPEAIYIGSLGFLDA